MHELAPLPELIARSSRGDENAFRLIVEQHQGYVFALAFRLVCNLDDAEDIVQETFINVWKHLASYDPRVKFTTWIYTITVNRAYDRLKAIKRRRRWITSLAVADDENTPASEHAEETRIANRDLAQSIRRLSGHLPMKQRMVFLLRDIQDLSIDEVARTLAMSPNAVKVNLSHARRSIRKRMEQD